MSKVFLLGARQEIDRNKQIVEINQIIQMEGYNYDKYVVYDIIKNEWGLAYKLICLKTKEFYTTDIIRPLSEKFGIGYYYDQDNLTFLDSMETALLLQEANEKLKAEKEEAERVRIRTEEVKVVGRKRFAEILPDDAQALIVARLKQDESDSQSDYFASSTVRTVILGFSTHKRDIFSEMRKHASNFEETACLAEYNADYEHREKYSMGAGYYLGESKYHGWIIEKVPVYDRNRTIEEFAYTAGNEDNIRIRQVKANTANKAEETSIGNFIIVDYSEKAIAVFGDTKAIKDQLKELGGRFNPKLTHKGEKKAGWIFQKAKEQQLRELTGLKQQS